MHADSESADWQLQRGFLLLSAGHDGWQLSVKFNIQKIEMEMELPQCQLFLHIRSLASSVSIRDNKPISLCNILMCSLDIGQIHFNFGKVVGVSQFAPALKKSLHFLLQKCLSAKMATIYLVGFRKNKDHMPIHCPWDLKYWSVTSLNEWQELRIVLKPRFRIKSKLKQLKGDCVIKAVSSHVENIQGLVQSLKTLF